MIEARSSSADETRALAAALAGLARVGDLILLAGDLGAGKTVFVQGFGRALGVQEPITSPTFTLVHWYDDGKMPLVHLDAYRLEYLQEFVDLGVAELLDDGVALVEWGDVVAAALPPDFLEVRIEFGERDDDRLLRVRAVGSSWAPRVEAIRRALAPWAPAPAGDGRAGGC